ncbi:MAG: hypothetical protein ACREGK_09145 [Geminicoccales bacterium]
MALRLIGCALVGSIIISASASSQPPERAELQVPVGQIEAYCDDFRQAMGSCFAAKGVPVAAGQPLTDAQIETRRQCRLEVQDEFDLYTASFCPGPEVSLAAADYAAMCVALNEQALPCLEQHGYQAVVGQPIRPEDYAFLRHCREQAEADMTVAKHCGPPAYSAAP